jgi:FkbM family methyltransferase
MIGYKSFVIKLLERLGLRSIVVQCRNFKLLLGGEGALENASQMALGLYEPAFTEICSRVKGVFIDVGANIGYFTVMVAKNAQQVISIEPDSDNFRYLRYNIEMNHLKNVIAICAAAFDKEDFVELQGHGSLAKVICPRGRSGSVPTIKLDKVANLYHIKHIDLIKIDVEGAEVEVLKGSKEVLTKIPKVKLLIEIHNRWKEVQTLLRNLGFSYEVLTWNDEGKPHHIYAY